MNYEPLIVLPNGNSRKSRLRYVTSDAIKGLFIPSVSVVASVAACIATCQDYTDAERHHYSGFALPHAETGTEIETNPVQQNSMGICVGLYLCSENTSTQFYTTPYFISPFICCGVRQCEHTINVALMLTSKMKWVPDEFRASMLAATLTIGVNTP